MFALGSISTKQVLQAVNLAATMYENNDSPLKVEEYSDNNVSAKVIKIIQSYVGIINKMIWRK